MDESARCFTIIAIYSRCPYILFTTVEKYTHTVTNKHLRREADALSMGAVARNAAFIFDVYATTSSVFISFIGIILV